MYACAKADKVPDVLKTVKSKKARPKGVTDKGGRRN